MEPNQKVSSDNNRNGQVGDQILAAARGTLATKSSTGRAKSSGPKRQWKLKKPVIIIAICALVVGIIVGLLASGVMYVGFKDRTQEVFLRTHVCSDELINQVVDFATGDDAKHGNVLFLADAATETEGLENYKNDPNCLGILAVDAMSRNDVDKLATVITMMKELGDGVQYMYNDLAALASLPTAESYLEIIKELD